MTAVLDIGVGTYLDPGPPVVHEAVSRQMERGSADGPPERLSTERLLSNAGVLRQVAQQAVEQVAAETLARLVQDYVYPVVRATTPDDVANVFADRFDAFEMQMATARSLLRQAGAAQFTMGSEEAVAVFASAAEAFFGDDGAAEADFVQSVRAMAIGDRPQTAVPTDLAAADAGQAWIFRRSLLAYDYALLTLMVANQQRELIGHPSLPTWAMQMMRRSAFGAYCAVQEAQRLRAVGPTEEPEPSPMDDEDFALANAD
jgi:hypothetical protein